MKKSLFIVMISLVLFGCEKPKQEMLSIEIIQTSAAGDEMKSIAGSTVKANDTIRILENSVFQTITGFGGAFTESSAYLLNQLSAAKRDSIMQAYFSTDGANYSLCRTHMNSCDFSLSSYSYAPVAGDTALEHFSIKEDMDDIVPMIKEAQEISKNGFKLISSPWTAPPWMKTNNDWFGGKLKPEYYGTWAKFFSKYAQAYQEQGIPIWAFTVENEPLGNNASWESMHYTPKEMADFVKNDLAPQLKKDNLDINILVYDQNRGEELKEWADELLTDPELLPLIYGTAVHWYSSTVDWFPESLTYTHELAPQKHLLHTEACVDNDVPRWQDDSWYWSKEATDWGYEWASEENKHMHPKYVPVYRYARDIIGCMNNWVEGWVDWNMVLDDQGGPNHAENWCVAPVIVKPETDEVYFTPLYYVMSHFSKYIRPGAQRIGWKSTDPDLMVTAARNPDGSKVVVVLNMAKKAKTFNLELSGRQNTVTISPQAIQTIVIAKS